MNDESKLNSFLAKGSEEIIDSLIEHGADVKILILIKLNQIK